jgi:hypothetical protein
MKGGRSTRGKEGRKEGDDGEAGGLGWGSAKELAHKEGRAEGRKDGRQAGKE